MRFSFRYSLTTFLMLPVLAGVAIKLYRGPHQYTLAEEREWLRAEDEKDGFVALCGGNELFESGTFWAYRNLDGSFMRHGPAVSIGFMGYKRQIEYRNGKKHGECRSWNRDDELCISGQYENDTCVGDWLYYSDGTVHQRVRYDQDRGQEIETRFELGRLAERRMKSPGADAVSLTVWHPNGQKRLEGCLRSDRAEGLWYWWDVSGREIRREKFHEGVPEEFLDGRQFIPAAAENIENLQCEFQDWLLWDVIEFIRAHGVSARIDCLEADAEEIAQRPLTAVCELPGPLALYFALREARLRIETRVDETGKEILVILPADSK